MGDGPDTGGEPEQLGQCAACGNVYTVQELDEGTYRPIGRTKECLCGCEEFAGIADD